MSIESVRPSNHLILCHPLLLLPSIFPSIRVFSNKSVLHIRWPKYCSFSFSISPSSEYSGLISFRRHWLDLPAVQGLKSSPTSRFKRINSSALSFLYGPTLTSIHDYWKNHRKAMTSLSNYLPRKPSRKIFIILPKILYRLAEPRQMLLALQPIIQLKSAITP